MLFSSRTPEPSRFTLVPIGLCAEDITLLTSMLAIVAIRSETRWALSPYRLPPGVVSHALELPVPSAYFVNGDSRDGVAFLERFHGRYPALCYGGSPAVDFGAYQLARPLRARHLLAALSALEQSLMTAPTVKDSGRKRA
jgi:hypothetical protein